MTTDQQKGRALNALRRIVQALRAGSKAAEKTLGLPGAQLFVLEQLAAARTPLSLNELAERTHTHQSSVSVVVSRLVESKHISRVRSEEDGRMLVLSLTAKGRSALTKSPGSVQEKMLTAMDELKPAELKQLADLLERIISATGIQAEKVEMFFDSAKSKKG